MYRVFKYSTPPSWDNEEVSEHVETYAEALEAFLKAIAESNGTRPIDIDEVEGEHVRTVASFVIAN